MASLRFDTVKSPQPTPQTRLRELWLKIDAFLVIMLGVVLTATFMPARGQGAVVAEWLTQAAIVLLFFLHGAKLSREAIVNGITAWKVHVSVSATTFLLFPLIGLAIHSLGKGHLSPSLLDGILFLCLLPSTVQSSIAFTAIARGNVAAAICSASISNLAGILITPLLVGALLGVSGGISLDAMIKIASQLLLPFVIGHLCRPWMIEFLNRNKSLIGRVDRGSILMVVYTAFSASVVEGLWSKVSVTDLIVVGVISLIIIKAVLWLTAWIARKQGLSREDVIVVQFCGSKKSLASGVPMASALFPATVLGPILLPLMIFHQVQLIVCAILARQYAKDAEV